MRKKKGIELFFENSTNLFVRTAKKRALLSATHVNAICSDIQCRRDQLGQLAPDLDTLTAEAYYRHPANTWHLARDQKTVASRNHVMTAAV